uniref:RING-type domain-containing protein n=1 Tax=Rodentolepis nana TaxID=102285 RepID=A0A158QIM5_RODNA
MLQIHLSLPTSPSTLLSPDVIWTVVNEVEKGQGSGKIGNSTSPSSSSPLLISLPLDMFSDLPSQLAIASNSTQVAVTGDIVLFAEPLTIFNLSAAEANSGNNTTDLSSSLLLLLIVCVLILLLGILLLPARLGIFYWQRFCSFSISRSVKSRRSRKLTAATKKALKQLPVKCLNQVDPLISEGFDQCAICIELFKPQDLIRSLPCRYFISFMHLLVIMLIMSCLFCKVCSSCVSTFLVFSLVSSRISVLAY